VISLVVVLVVAVVLVLLVALVVVGLFAKPSRADLNDFLYADLLRNVSSSVNDDDSDDDDDDDILNRILLNSLMCR